jgi:hypothetical protein
MYGGEEKMFNQNGPFSGKKTGRREGSEVILPLPSY